MSPDAGSGPKTSSALDYPMKDIPKSDPRFQAVFLAVLKEVEKSSAVLRAETITITQTIDKGRLLARLGGQQILILSPDEEFADGEKIKRVAIPTTELFEYVDTQKAPRKIRIYKLSASDLPIPVSPLMTDSEFIDQLRMGETYVISKGSVEKPCVTCGGWGKLKADRVGGEKPICRECKGVGKFILPQEIRVKW